MPEQHGKGDDNPFANELLTLTLTRREWRMLVSASRYSEKKHRRTVEKAADAELVQQRQQSADMLLTTRGKILEALARVRR